jgi:DNA repair exonuclease SbcCD nuclease subunit
MFILVIGDEHFENKNEIETNQMCDKIYQIVLEKKPNIIVSLGDSLHQHSNIHMAPLKRATNFFYRLSNMCEHLYILIGNHDRPNNMTFLTDESPFFACKMWPNTTVVDKVHIDDTNKIVFLPYVPPGRFMEALQTVDIDENNICDYKLYFAHQEFKGCKMGAIISSNGDEWNPVWPLCISGHIHDYQMPQDNLLYPGTPIQLSYGSSASKGVLLFNLGDEIKDDNFIDLNIAKKLIIHLTPEQLTSYKLPDNTYVKIICKGDTKVIREITKMENVISLIKNPYVKFAIQEDKKKNTSDVFVKVETIGFQKRLFTSINDHSSEVKTLFSEIFGTI